MIGETEHTAGLRDPCHHLPIEVWRLILTHLDPYEICQVARASKCWNKIAMDPILWEYYLKRDFGPGKDASSESWVNPLPFPELRRDLFLARSQKNDSYLAYREMYKMFVLRGPEGMYSLAREGIGSSPKDRDQGVEFTLGDFYFFGSRGRTTAESEDWLDYRVVEGSIISSVAIVAMKSRVCYAPQYIQLLVGPEPGKWTTASEVFACDNTDEIQKFELRCPIQCVGTYCRLRLIGKYERHFVHGFRDMYYVCLARIFLLGYHLGTVVPALRRMIDLALEQDAEERRMFESSTKRSAAADGTLESSKSMRATDSTATPSSAGMFSSASTAPRVSDVSDVIGELERWADVVPTLTADRREWFVPPPTTAD
eukprot:Clim_evm115s149 gene=Clim_evmTU115s149